jgi:hypothetical protein
VSVADPTPASEPAETGVPQTISSNNALSLPCIISSPRKASDAGVGFEACLGPSDGLFIPRGWWHSIKGVGGGVTASNNALSLPCIISSPRKAAASRLPLFPSCLLTAPIGHPPTYTPLHRDPNPNIFVQLAGEKVVRLLAPTDRCFPTPTLP